MQTKLVKLAILPILFLPLSAFSQGVLLNAGDSYVFEFSSLDYYGPPQPTQGGMFFANFAANSFMGGESLRIDLFPDLLFDTPSSYTFVMPTDPTETYRATILWSSFDPPFWPDLRGMAQITMLTGVAQLDGIGVHQIVNGGLYSQFFPVPEPSVSVLGLVGIGGLVFLRRRYRVKNRT